MCFGKKGSSNTEIIREVPGEAPSAVPVDYGAQKQRQAAEASTTGGAPSTFGSELATGSGGVTGQGLM